MPDQVPVTLRDVTRADFHALVMVKGVPGDGHPPLFEPHVASVAVSLAQALVEPEWTPRAVYAGEEPVGFGMWGVDRELEAPFVTRLIVDYRRQRRGYGRHAMTLMLAEIAATGAPEAYVSLVEGNAHAETLYASMGFARTGRTVGFGAHQEPLLRLVFRAARRSAHPAELGSSPRIRSAAAHDAARQNDSERGRP